jgi:hypothetical protein
VAKADSALESGAAESNTPESASAAAQEPATESPATVTAPPPEPRRVTVEIYSPYSFCYPSLDESKPSVSPARYAAVLEGDHTGFLHHARRQQDQGGQGERLSPSSGGVLRIKVDRNAQGQPVLAASKTTGPRQPDPGAAGKRADGAEQPR